MILLDISKSVRSAYHMDPVEVTPLMPAAEWYRFWRVDARRIKPFGEVMLFTNHETLFTFVADSRKFTHASDFAVYFMLRYTELLHNRFGYGNRIKEQVVAHRGVDRSVIGVMNSLFAMSECRSGIKDHAELERSLNEIPVVSRNLIPSNALRQKLLRNA